MATKNFPELTPEYQRIDVRLSEVIGALSYALDITEGQPDGHAARSCMLGMRLAREIRLSLEESSALFYALLLKDLGCSTNASKVCYLFGADDRSAKRDLKVVDWSSQLASIGYVAKTVSPNGSIWERMGRFARVAIGGPKSARELVELRCDRGARIAHDLQLPDATSIAIRSLDEHWDGHGYPDGLRGEEIPLLARILGLAQTVEVFASTDGIDAAYSVAQERRGEWFEPDLVDAFLSFRNDDDFWANFFDDDPKQAVSKFEPAECTLTADNATLDRIAHGFAQVIDAKSPWTFRHSEGVARIAVGLAKIMGMPEAQVRDISRAGLLHDIGKLGVSNLILDKPGKLDADELAEMRKHPAYTYQIMDRVAGFRSLAGLAASHHERLDGKGYHLGLTAEQLPPFARILAVADMYEALSAKRPYRTDLTDEQVMDILARNVGPGICPEVFSALQTYRANGGYVPTPIAA
jgi:HD-GYP domain-containing protein (c-di-GMP phosphodiesterase class II)